MARLGKEDLAQMNRDYFQSLEKERLVEVADNLHQTAVEQWEKINSNSSNSSQPPSTDNPFEKPEKLSKSTNDIAQEPSSTKALKKKSSIQAAESKQKRKPGKQKGSKGFGRSQLLKVSDTVGEFKNIPIRRSLVSDLLISENERYEFSPVEFLRAKHKFSLN